jgi:flagellar basal-body rod protein FlgB
MNLLRGPEFSRLQGAIGAAELRQQVIADNVANVDTPGFKRSEVVFEDYLQRELSGAGSSGIAGKRTNAKHFVFGQGGSNLQPQLVTDHLSVMNNNINNVDIDREMSLLAKNQLRYNALIRQLNHDFSMMRIGIEGRA